jgi:hypothetical protein
MTMTMMETITSSRSVYPVATASATMMAMPMSSSAAERLGVLAATGPGPRAPGSRGSSVRRVSVMLTPPPGRT